MILKLLGKYDNLQDGLTIIRNLTYVSIVATLILTATTVYFAIRKPETMQKTKAKKG